ncbi:MAG: ornithine cyclodeaminase family protein [Halodesulfurarchaeum sp.]
MVRILSSDEVRSLIDLEDVLDAVEETFAKQRAGDVERPERPHYPVGKGLDAEDPDTPMGTALVMPAYVHGSEHFATKLVSVHDGNPSRGLSTVNAQITVNDASTGLPVAYMDGTFITSARTGSIGGLTARTFTEGPVTVGVIGAGTQARWQLRAIAAATEIDRIHWFDIDESVLAEGIDELEGDIDAPIEAVDRADAAASDVDILVTATTSPEPVFDGEALTPGTVVVGIGAYTPEMQEIGSTTFERANVVYADVPTEVATIGDVTGAGQEVTDLVPFSDALAGKSGRSDGTDIIVVESVGSAVMDAVTANYVFERARADDVGTDVTL